MFLEQEDNGIYIYDLFLCADVTAFQYLCVKILTDFLYSLFLNLFQKNNKKFKFLLPVRKN
jgi:hypothetical protein